MSEKKSDFLVPISIIIAGALIALGIYFSGGEAAVQQARDNKRPPVKTIEATKSDLLKSGILLGNPEAPIVLAEFADFQCPFCGRFSNETKSKLIDAYVKTGKVLFVYHDFAFLGEESFRAAEAARCANEQEKFWQYHDYIYTYLSDNYYGKGKNGENVGALSDENLKNFAKLLQLDTAAFNQCFDSGKYKDIVLADVEQGRALGITGTPGFVIDNEVFSGALPFSEFQRLIEAKLKQE